MNIIKKHMAVAENHMKFSPTFFFQENSWGGPVYSPVYFSCQIEKNSTAPDAQLYKLSQAYGNHRETIENDREKQWKSLNNRENHWKPMKIIENMEINENH